ncbi:MAG: heat-inducible transcription repressor HrcA [Bacilli bacterium]|nr:heat-inducible transcription repressor HrcA [Bacilli bacterium]
MLSNRQNEILKLIIEEYSKVPVPVGSKSICDKLNISSATVRAEMAKLEDIGYLEKTHVSSGRVPSENGYKYYVNNLMKPKEMTGEDMLNLQTIFQNKSLVLSDAIEKSLEIISEITNYTAINLENNESRLKKVEVVPLSVDNLLAIVITDNGHVENKKIDLKNSDLEEIRKTVELINKLIVGTPINEVSEKLEYEIKPIIGQYIQNHEMIYNAFYNAFSDLKNKDDMTMKGKNKILELEEFSNNADKIKKIINKFDDENIVSSIKEEDGGINVYIGTENNIDEDLTVIKTKYNAKGEEGTLAIIGPKRMDYDRVVSLLDYLKSCIERE